ncbi:MAG TPA: MBL fold metallo-hydrolase, partial [Thermoanaerobaculia bacterium]
MVLSESRSMVFKQFYLGCLAHASYLIGSNGEAAVVDPQRDVDQYIAEADRHGLRVQYVLETHLHADFVSGHRELAERTGAEIVFGHAARAAFPHRAASDGDEFSVGTVGLRILETPGHTPESISILVSDHADPNTPQKVLTGDTLFIGDVGRPDLVAAVGYSKEQMAGLLYDSLHHKLLALDDSVEVFPAHGAGSLCGRNISKETSSTIGEQRRFNYALKPMPREDFIRMMTVDLPEQPQYFSRDAEINRSGATPLSDLPPPEPLSPSEMAGRGAVVLDVRTPAEFGAGHLPGSINIGLGGQYASWAGTLIPIERDIILVADEDRLAEARVRLARVGLENVAGYLSGGIKAWSDSGRPLGTIPQIAVDELHARLSEDPRLQVVDVRQPGEFESGHPPGAISAPL